MIAKVSLALNIILAAAVIYLFSAIGNKSHEPKQDSSDKIVSEKSQEPSDSLDFNSAGAPKIAYVLGDSINEKYQYLLDKQDDLIQRNRKSDAKVRREMESAQERYMVLMQKAQQGGFSSEAEAMAAETELQQMQIRIEELQQEESESLARSERALQLEFFERVQKFLSTYSEENDIDMVMNIQMGGSVLYGKNSFDVTSDVIKKMNQEYAAEIAAKSVK